MKVPVNYLVSQVLLNMNEKVNANSGMILELMSSHQETLDISVSVLSFVCVKSEQYSVAADLLVKYGSKEEIEEFLKENERMIKIDNPKAYQKLKIQSFIGDDLSV